MDEAFEAAHGPVAAYVAAHSWPAFREAERALLAATLAAHPTGAVVSCGGGIVESDGGSPSSAARLRL
jgi:pentafunctional AROM polypeptide